MTSESARRTPAPDNENGDIAALMRGLGRSARAAARQIGTAPAEQRDRALLAMATALREHAPTILAANRQDLADAHSSGLAASFIVSLALRDDEVAQFYAPHARAWELLLGAGLAYLVQQRYRPLQGYWALPAALVLRTPAEAGARSGQHRS